MRIVLIIFLSIACISAVSLIYAMFEVWLKNRLIIKLKSQGLTYTEINQELKRRGYYY